MLKVGCSEDPKCVKFRYVWWVPGWNFQKTIFPRSEMFSLTTLKCTWIFRLWQVNPLKSGGKTGRSKPEQQQHLRCNNFGRQNMFFKETGKTGHCHMWPIKMMVIYRTLVMILIVFDTKKEKEGDHHDGTENKLSAVFSCPAHCLSLAWLGTTNNQSLHNFTEWP